MSSAKLRTMCPVVSLLYLLVYITWIKIELFMVALDVSLFFKSRKGHHKEFSTFWKSVKASRRKTFDRYLGAAGDAVSAFDS